MKRMIVLVLLLALLLSGCSLAQRGEDGQDVLVGFLATRKPLDLFDFAGYLKEHPEALNGGEVSVDKAHQGRLYGSWEPEQLSDGSETLRCVFPVEDAFFAICAVYPPVPGSLDYIFNSSSGEFLSLDTSCVDTEAGREVTIAATVAAVTAAAGNVTFYLNPVYQSPDGSVYVTEGSGTTSDASQPGSGFSQTLEETASISVDGDTIEAYHASLSFSLELRSAPQSVTVRQVAADGAPLSEEVYNPGALPETLAPAKDCAYLVVETRREDGTVDRILSEAGEEALSTEYEKDGLLAKQQTNLNWP